MSRLYFLVAGFSFSAVAESIASFPKGWETWPVVKLSETLPADTVLPPDASLFIQEAVEAYSWINNGEGSPLTIRVNPKKIEEYKTHGPYSDGPTAVAVSEIPGMIWVTEHLSGFPVYGTYDRQGNDISHTHPSLDPDFCDKCHQTYQEICRNGTCTDLVMKSYSSSGGKQQTNDE
ncbi:hypothetical protein CS022_12000 [Veronia nyctiphanis]|uniref:Uncharacterized protein n=1 Tax=Veronia nyctiphanis TaxID=1278244 RepID=A0A4Q0YR45_9GAMM|nr:hypothetical protein [Veronia nyctiphanis]RXJ73075.1 hypothetical protein CS022_12000 [Veronia nyctiphanis]